MTQNRAWKTTDPTILDWADNIHNRRNEALDKAKAYFDEKWEGRTGRTWEWGAGFSITGMGVLRDPESRIGGSKDYREPPLGWRYDQKKKFLVPAKKTDEGKAIQQELDALAHSVNRPANVPRDLHSVSVDGEGFMYAVVPEVLVVALEGSYEIDSTTYDSDYDVKETWLTFHRPLDDRSIKTLAETGVWEPQWLSTYWRTKEMHDALKAEVMAGTDAT